MEDTIEGTKENFVRMLLARRIGGHRFGRINTVYKFQKIKSAKALALIENPGKEILDFGVGEPDEMAFDLVRNRLKQEVDDPQNRGYADNGITEFKESASQYMNEVYGVSVDPETEINHTIGSKSALAMFPAILVEPGDTVLMTVPGYPVLGTHASWYGAEVVNLPLKEENAFLPDLDSIPKDQLARCKILVLNYPNNPTGAGATQSFYEKVVEFARENKIVVVQDAAYASLIYDSKPLSFLSVDGAKEVGVEFHSLSKAYNMTGWRLGFVCGNELLVKAFAHVKDNIDSGQFVPIQKAGISALQNPSITQEILKKYSRRLDRLVKILRDHGFSAKKPDGTFYLFVRAPKSVKGEGSFESAEEFSQYLIRRKLISTVPWDETGNFIRFSVTFEQDEESIWQELERRFQDLRLVF